MISSSVKKQISKLKQKKYRKLHQEYLIEGVKNIYEAIQHAEVLLLVVDGTRREEDAIIKIIELADAQNIPIEYAGSKDISQIQSTETFPGVLAIVERPETDIYEAIDSIKGTVLAIQGVSDPGNLGTIIRTADWFGIRHIILGEQSTDPFSEKCVRSTMGSIHRVHIYETDHMHNVLSRLKKNSYKIFGYTLSGEKITKDSNLEKNNAVHLFGSESHGISNDILPLLDKEFTISGNGNAESLNLGISAGIVMWQLQQ